MDDRQYVSRKEFSKDVRMSHLVRGSNGILTWNPATAGDKAAGLREYFTGRREDGTR
jgi:hypothetical protein